MVALLWYDSNKIKVDTEWQTYFQLINHYATKWRSLFAPLLSASIYTIGYPLLKWGISAFNAWVGSKEEDAVLKLSDSGSVPTTRFVKEMRKSKEKIKELSEIIQEESKVLSKNQELELEIVKKARENDALLIDKKMLDSQKNYQIKSATDSFLDGRWEISLTYETLEVNAIISLSNMKVTSSTYTKGGFIRFVSITDFIANLYSKVSIFKLNVEKRDNLEDFKVLSEYDKEMLNNLIILMTSHHKYDISDDDLGFVTDIWPQNFSISVSRA